MQDIGDGRVGVCVGGGLYEEGVGIHSEKRYTKVRLCYGSRVKQGVVNITLIENSPICDVMVDIHGDGQGTFPWPPLC